MVPYSSRTFRQIVNDSSNVHVTDITFCMRNCKYEDAVLV